MINKIKLFNKKVDAVLERHATFFKWLRILIGVCLIVLDFFMFMMCQALIVVMAGYTGISDSEGLGSLVLFGTLFSFIFVSMFWLIIKGLIKIIGKKGYEKNDFV